MNAQDGNVTPMMAQYLEIKGRYADALLFYRMGDFYEMFFEDAEAAAAALDIALTKRGQHLGKDIPMCGVPVHSAEGYLLALIRKGFRVAIAEQMEDPAGGEEARVEIRGGAGCSAAGDAGHIDRGNASGGTAAQLPGRLGRGSG